MSGLAEETTLSAARGLDELEVTRAEVRRLAAVNRRLVAELDAIPDLVLRLDRNGRLLDVHPSDDEQLPVPASQLVGTDAEALFPSWAGALAAAVQGALSRRTLQIFTFEDVRGGCLRYFEARLTPCGDDEVLVLVRDVSVRRRHEDELTHQASHDPLTGLANRALFRLRVEEALRRGSAAVLVLDLDGFKAVNDSLGHPAGDQLLVECARRLSTRLRAGDTLARLGGDEFAALLVACKEPEHALAVADDLLDALTEPFAVAGRAVDVAGSIGISVARTRRDVDEMLGEADLAMYDAKAAGKGGARVYRDELRSVARHRYQLATELHQSLDNGELAVHYQPIVLLDSGRVVGVEALARWNSPTRGPVSPVEFIAIAEESDLIKRVGARVLEESCHQVAAWVASGADLRVGVNLSPRQLGDDAVLDVVAGALRRSGLDPTRLVLEITESLLVDDAALARLTRLRELGARIAVDDFGTGYSSLSYLRRLPLDIVKLDRTFVRGMASDRSRQALVDAVILLCDRLFLDVVAEGVETEAERTALVDRGCRVGQGYLFARPQPADRFGALLDRRSDPVRTPYLALNGSAA